jgi:murein DD-endopeptidase MepM/ murein hydrolase activator NlpD
MPNFNSLMKPYLIAIVFSLQTLASSCWALQIKLPDCAYQGDLIVGRVEPLVSVFVNGKAHPVSSEGYFVIGVPSSQKTDLSVSAGEGEEKISKTLRVFAYPWKIQRIDGLPKRYVEPPPEALEQIRKDNQKVRKIRQAESHVEPLFLRENFASPVNGKITGSFGSQRILNGLPCNPHSGIDIAAPKGTPVYSPADGMVRLVAENMYLMGNVLMIDHGLGVKSIFIHLDSIHVREGESVEKGKMVARVGKTGRATGPHLHWGVSVGSTLVDPARLVNKSNQVP